MNAPTNHRHHCAALVRAAVAAASCVVAWAKRLMHLASAPPRRMACPAWPASLPACLAALAAFLMLPAL